MVLNRAPRVLLQRIAAVVLLLVVIPVMVALSSVSEAAPVRSGEPSPRTVVASEVINLVDVEATELAKRTASESVGPVRVVDEEAQATVVAAVREIFQSIEEARRPRPGPTPAPAVDSEGNPAPSDPSTREPTREEQLAALRDELVVLGDDALLALIDLDPLALNLVEAETVEIAQNLARSRISAEELSRVVSEQLRSELAVRDFPGEVGQLVVRPLIESVMQPTVTVDPDATAAARQRAADAVADVVQSWRSGDVIVRSGEVVTPLQSQALSQLGLEGTDPWRAFGTAMLAMAVVVVAASAYLRAMQPLLFASGRKVLLLASLVAGFAAVTVGVDVLAETAGRAWWYLVPGGALAMLGALLASPIVGLALLVPAVVLVLMLAPDQTAAAVFVAGAVMGSVPLVTDLSSRGDLRRATLRGFLGYPLLALALEIAFASGESPVVAILAGLGNGVLTAMLVQGVLPFLESTFRLPTVTALLDLADRNHPLLRELEQKALGSYNHSVMVASLVERACRQIGANPLLGSVAALYHDIGKVRQPHFFIENQQGIANPHDELEPRISAVIIQNHVVDGVEMAREYKLPPEVVAAIGSHHGTMLVSYFYNKALRDAGGDVEAVDEQEFRYSGHKPRRKEAAILFIADSSEAATRAAAMKKGTLPREEIEQTVDKLIQERLDDNQFDNTDLTFHELTTVRNSIVEALVGVYHPRIDYPQGELPAAARARRDAAAASSATVAPADAGGDTATKG